jgi:hypothetical protein
MHKSLNRFYYLIKPFLNRGVQLFVRRQIIKRQRKKYEHSWPIDPAAGKPPLDWPGWPEKKQFAFVLTHDVDTAIGFTKCEKLMEVEKALGFRSSFNFVPERYSVSADTRHLLTGNGFEVGVHGLLHDGKLYNSPKIFAERALKINGYLEKWQAVGFRSPAMHHRLDWLHQLNIEYDASTFDTDPFEPMSDGAKTIFPFWVSGNGHSKGYLELPYSLPQDFTMFILLKERNIEIWKRKLDWIVENGGMALLNTHPDYMNFHSRKEGLEEYAAARYTDFLNYVKRKFHGFMWHALPRELSAFWVQNIQR